MISRYTREEMGRIWSDENRFTKWLEVEVLACEAWAALGKIPKKSLQKIKKKAAFDVKRVTEVVASVKHDVIAFLTVVAEHVGADARFIHMGMTSSDLLDTAFAAQMVDASRLIVKGLKGDETIVVSGLMFARPGSKVTPLTAEQFEAMKKQKAAQG